MLLCRTAPSPSRLPLWPNRRCFPPVRHEPPKDARETYLAFRASQVSWLHTGDGSKECANYVTECCFFPPNNIFLISSFHILINHPLMLIAKRNMFCSLSDFGHQREFGFFFYHDTEKCSPLRV